MLLNLLFDFLNQNVMTMSERIIFNTISIVILWFVYTKIDLSNKMENKYATLSEQF